MQVFNNFNELASGQSALQSDMNVFNVSFAGLQKLSQTERGKVEEYANAVRQAEADFRAADDEKRQRENAVKQEIAQANAKLRSVSNERVRAAQAFERQKASLEAPLSEFGVTVTWDEPQVVITFLENL